MTDYALAQEGAAPVSDDVIKPEMKQGHKCCGVCCDVRRATIIINCIGLGLGMIGIFFLIFANTSASALDADYYDDDEMKAAIYELEGANFGGVLAFCIAAGRLALNGVGIWGALKYNVIAIGVAAAAYGLEMLFSLITLNILGVVMHGFFLYPHIYLIMEIRSGIMSEETYEVREKQSCCCV